MLLNKSSGEQNVPQPKARSDQNILQHQKPSCEVGKRFTEAIVFTKNPWPILSDDKYSTVEEAWKQVMEVQNHQRALADAPVGTPSVWELPGVPSLTIDPQT